MEVPTPRTLCSRVTTPCSPKTPSMKAPKGSSPTAPTELTSPSLRPSLLRSMDTFPAWPPRCISIPLRAKVSSPGSETLGRSAAMMSTTRMPVQVTNILSHPSKDTMP